MQHRAEFVGNLFPNDYQEMELSVEKHSQHWLESHNGMFQSSITTVILDINVGGFN